MSNDTFRDERPTAKYTCRNVFSLRRPQRRSRHFPISPENARKTAILYRFASVVNYIYYFVASSADLSAPLYAIIMDRLNLRRYFQLPAHFLTIITVIWPFRRAYLRCHSLLELSPLFLHYDNVRGCIWSDTGRDKMNRWKYVIPYIIRTKRRLPLHIFFQLSINTNWRCHSN